ncbi:type II secretion system F family protein [uncultured Serinicoccus sp.]|uniref:type II secretion system F family protein n=1 Tax=uncultured Serinicoccus sp. TaxID=735514 RepID=UPI00261051DA|nr:type II secretion system F family protein [uncultured Serinicoccus sp.]
MSLILSPWAAALLILAGLGLALAVILVPSTGAAARRRVGATQQESALTRATERATASIASTVARGRRGLAWERALDRAGFAYTLPEYLLLVGAAALVGFAVGVVLGSVVIAVMLVGFAVAGSVMLVSVKAERRRNAFAEQLDDLLTLLASNLRAGHSLQQSLDSLTADTEDPAAGEISRAVTQIRVGRDTTEALADVAERMDSDDFRWVVQAIAIHRMVGGNLSEVLDTVAETIRSRGQLRRQVEALSAEGKLSGRVLMALPFFVILVLSFVSPGYLSVFTTTTLGFLMMGAAGVLLVVGFFWMRATVKVTF